MIAILRAEAGERPAERFNAGLNEGNEGAVIAGQGIGGGAWLLPGEVLVDLSELPDESIQPTPLGAAPSGLRDLGALSGLVEAAQAVPEGRKVHAEALPEDLLEGLEFRRLGLPWATPPGLGKRDVLQILMEGQHLGLDVHQKIIGLCGDRMV